MNNTRIDELMAGMNNSFSKEAYHKSELLDEMFTLQKEIVALTFNDEHAVTGDLRIWDVERHLEQMNEDCGNVADEELARFKEGSRDFCNMIKAEISGKKGEQKAFRNLEYLQCKNKVLRNIELKDGDFRTELDAIVITRSGITIVEVKNTSRDIFIDENGDYFRTGEYNKWDKNIADNLEHKEEMLKKAISESGVENVDVRSIVVFTDRTIQVQNKCNKVRICFLSQLIHMIDSHVTTRNMSDEDMDMLEDSIRNAEHMEKYPAGFDADEYKRSFAVLMTTLEEASAQADETEEVIVETKQNNFIRTLQKVLTSRHMRTAGGAVAGIAAGLLVSTVVDLIKR